VRERAADHGVRRPWSMVAFTKRAVPRCELASPLSHAERRDANIVPRPCRNRNAPREASAILGSFTLAYGVRRVDGVTVQRQSEIASDSGQVGYRGYWRVDGRVLLADAARILVHSAT
jgi:hypothetical protein